MPDNPVSSPSGNSITDIFDQYMVASSWAATDSSPTQPVVTAEVPQPRSVSSSASDTQSIESMPSPPQPPAPVTPPPPRKTNWDERGAARIVTHEKTANGQVVAKVTTKNIKDFTISKDLGEGSYSTVVLAADKSTGLEYAIKVLDKRHIIREKKVKYVNIEKNALNRLSNGPGIVHLFYTFQDEQSLYFVLDYAPHGELLALIKNHGSLTLEATHYYAAQIIDAISYMHNHGVVHRDIKPENILIDSSRRVLVTDFGTAKLLDKSEDGEYPEEVKANSFVGTAEYVSPELLNDKYCGTPADVWAFGCILYQMIAGKPPFKGSNEYQTFQKVMKLQYAFSAGFPMIIRDLVKRILVTKPCDRLTVDEVKAHYFFRDICWDDHSVWTAPAPALEAVGPYKMTAQAMKPIPVLATPTKRDTRRSNSRNSPADSTHSFISKPTISCTGSLPTTPPASAASSHSVSAPSTPSSAAAAALSRSIAKQYGSAPAAPHSRPQTQRHFSAPVVEFIPGTTIPRPRLNTRVGSITSSRANTGPRSIHSHESLLTSIDNVPAMSSLDLQWSDFFVSKDERVLKAGIVDLTKFSSADFEKRYKGMMAESPLGYRSHDIISADPAMDDPDAVTLNDGLDSPSDTDASEANSGKAFTIRNFFSKNSTTEPSSHNRTMVVTTFGRAMFFMQSHKRNRKKYQLAADVDLTNGNVHFVELLIDRHRTADSLRKGTFAILSSDVALACRVERLEVGQWTNMLAKARQIQQKRIVRKMTEREPVAPVLKPTNSTGSAFKAASLAAQKSPKIAASGGTADVEPLLAPLSATKTTVHKKGRRPPPPLPQEPEQLSKNQMISAALSKVASDAPASSGVSKHGHSITGMNSRMLARARKR